MSREIFKTYRFRTFQEMVEVVPPDRISACLNNLGISSHFVADYISDVCKNNNDIEWVDDGSDELFLDGEKIVVGDD